MDVLGAELAMLVSETEEEVVNNPGDGTVVPSRSSEPHCPIILVYLWSYNYPHQQLHKLSFTSCHYVMSSQGLRNLTSPLPCHAPHVRCAELLWPHPPLYCRSHHLAAHSLQKFQLPFIIFFVSQCTNGHLVCEPCHAKLHVTTCRYEHVPLSMFCQILFSFSILGPVWGNMMEELWALNSIFSHYFLIELYISKISIELVKLCGDC